MARTVDTVRTIRFMWTVSHFSSGSKSVAYTHDAIEHPIKGSWIAYGGCEKCLVGLKAIIANEPDRYTAEQLRRYEAWARAWDEHDLTAIRQLSDINHYGQMPTYLQRSMPDPKRAKFIDEISDMIPRNVDYEVFTREDGTRVPVPPNPYASMRDAVAERRVQWHEVWRESLLNVDDMVRAQLEAKAQNITIIGDIS